MSRPPRQRHSPGEAVREWPEAGHATDSELLTRCRDGDEAAWDLLVARHERLVFTVAMSCGVSREEATDITQTTFIALLEGIDHLRDGERLASWLITVASRTAVRARQRVQREKASALPGEELEDPVGEWERVAWLYEGVHSLPGPCRELLVALYLDPRSPSYADVATRLGHAIGSIGPMRGRCLERLRAILTTEEAT